MRVLTITVLATALALAACAEDERSGHEPTAKERSAANDLIRQVSAIDALQIQPADAPRLLTATTFTPVLSMLAPDGLSVVLPGRDHVRDLRPCITQTSDTVVYTDCEIAEHIVEGSVSGLERWFKAELIDVFVVSPENHGATTIKATFNTNGDSIDGTLELDVMWSAAGGDNTLDATVGIDNVILDGFDCAVGGSITMSGQVGDQPKQTRTLSFGPNCGDILVAR